MDLESNKNKTVTANNNNKITSFEEEGFNINISDDQISVTIDLFPPKDETKNITFQSIKNELNKLEIKTELFENEIKKAVEGFNINRNPKSGIVVTNGMDSKKGKDGWFELSCSKKQSDDRRTAFDEKFEEIISLKKDDLIGIIHKPEHGKDGMDVFGKIIPGERGKEKAINLGDNVYTKEKIVISVYAEIDGFLDIKSTTISVVETYTVYGDIDYRTGNILGYGSLKVIGNVQNGYFLNLKNNIDIGGYVGDSEIISGNNIKIIGGFLGAGTGIIKAGGNVEVKFIQDQKVYSRGSLNFVREIVNSKIYVKDKITGKGNHASIIGGYTLAGSAIDIYSSGNEYGNTTIIEAGYDYEITDILIKNRKKINELKKGIKKISIEIFEYSQMKRLNPKMYDTLKQLAEKHTAMNTEIQNLNIENKNIVKTLRVPSGAFIKISNAIHPGTKIIINRKNFLVKEKLFAKTFKLSEENEIIMV